uniref:Uncharacterized protein n=1 Tax=Myotis myotis TaxID=51298 RepID=A0A7J7SRB7_MYOMY|nr:hypothetical protein mMyoMyo1_009339 [Myotis myotis]
MKARMDSVAGPVYSDDCRSARCSFQGNLRGFPAAALGTWCLWSDEFVSSFLLHPCALHPSQNQGWRPAPREGQGTLLIQLSSLPCSSSPTSRAMHRPPHLTQFQGESCQDRIGVCVCAGVVLFC